MTRMPRARRGQFMVKLESDTEVYFQAQAAPASGYAELEFHFPGVLRFSPSCKFAACTQVRCCCHLMLIATLVPAECPETDNCKEIRTLSKDNSDIWRGSLAWSSWTWVPPSGWTPVAQARKQSNGPHGQCGFSPVVSRGTVCPSSM